jgi:hypothetical protein
MLYLPFPSSRGANGPPPLLRLHIDNGGRGLGTGFLRDSWWKNRREIRLGNHINLDSGMRKRAAEELSGSGS